jgi:hypothetical protein
MNTIDSLHVVACFRADPVSRERLRIVLSRMRSIATALS